MKSKVNHYKEDLIKEVKKQSFRSHAALENLETKATKNVEDGLTETEIMKYRRHKKQFAAATKLIDQLEAYNYD